MIPSGSAQAHDPLVINRQGVVGWLIFNRPEVGNAMNARMLADLESAWTELDEDPAVKVIVNTGEGRAFQTGLDVVELARRPDDLREQSRRTARAELRFTAWHNSVRKPVIAAVNGVCAGGGLHFIADADVVIASRDATFLDPHVSVGQVTAYEAIGLMRKISVEAVFRMALVGRHERIAASRALDLGMISEIVEPERLRPRAQEIAEMIARNSSAAVIASKRALWGGFEEGLDEARRNGAEIAASMLELPDHVEGLRSFVEGRPAVWVD